MECLGSADFWIGLLKIVWINIILSGDNAVFFGSDAAVVLRVALTLVAAKLLALSFLQMVGGLLLRWIGLQLLSQDDDDGTESKRSGGLMAAVRTILIANLVMSLDNVIAVAVAVAAKGNMVLLSLGLAISIPLVVFGSTLMIKLMERFPIIILLGAALIGWVGGETIVSDTALQSVASAYPDLYYIGAVAGAGLVILLEKKRQRRHAQ